MESLLASWCLVFSAKEEDKMNLVLISLLIGFICTLLIYSLVVSLSTLEDLEWRDWLTLWPYQHWLGEFKDLFSFTIFLLSTVIFSLVFWANLKLTMMEKAAASRGECVCDCKACKDSLKLSKAAIAYLELNAEDIEELSKYHLVETNSVANPISK